MNESAEGYSRPQRYRLAKKGLRYKVYVAIEIIFAIVSVSAIFAASLTENGILLWTLSVIALMLSMLHHFSQLLERPHIFVTCLFWSLVFYFIYDIWIASAFDLPQAGPLLLLIAGFCYLIRGENLVNLDAAASIADMRSSSEKDQFNN